MPTERTYIVATSPLRRRMRKLERELQAALNRRDLEDQPESQGDFHLLKRYGVPDWAEGVRVEKAGLFNHAVVATEHRGA